MIIPPLSPGERGFIKTPPEAKKLPAKWSHDKGKQFDLNVTENTNTIREKGRFDVRMQFHRCGHMGPLSRMMFILQGFYKTDG